MLRQSPPKFLRSSCFLERLAGASQLRLRWSGHGLADKADRFAVAHRGCQITSRIRAGRTRQARQAVVDRHPVSVNLQTKSSSTRMASMTRQRGFVWFDQMRLEESTSLLHRRQVGISKSRLARAPCISRHVSTAICLLARLRLGAERCPRRPIRNGLARAPRTTGNDGKLDRSTEAWSSVSSSVLVEVEQSPLITSLMRR